MDVRELIDRLNGQARAVASHLLPSGKEHQREWVVGSINGEPGQSLKVCIAGAKLGKWADFATGESGDLLDLWCRVKGATLPEAIQQAKEWAGISEPKLERLGAKKFRRPERHKAIKKPSEESKVYRYLSEERKLLKTSISAYKVAEAQDVGPFPGWKTQEPWKGPWIVFPSLRDNELVFCKYLHIERKDGKKQTIVESNCEPCLFGWQAISDSLREVVICEGEIDAITFHQYGFPALSVPFGGGAGEKQQWINYEYERLERFETIYLAMDNDSAGHEAIEEIVSRLGAHRCRIVTLPHKDANECLKAGVTAEAIANCLMASKYRKPEELITFKEIHQGIIEEFYPRGGIIPGFTSPWEAVPFRFRRSELSVWTGVNGHGKSLALSYLMLNAAFQGERVCIASLEMPTKKTAYRLIRQATGEYRPSLQKINDCMEWFDGKFYLFNLVGTAKVEKIIETFNFAYKRYGVRQFVIDSMMKCGIAEDDYNGQKRFMETLCDFVNATEAHVHLVAHSRKHENEDYQVGKLDIKGTGAISDLAWNAFTIWRNKKKENAMKELKDTGTTSIMNGKRPLTMEELQAMPDAMLICDKARNEEWEGKARLFYDWPSMQYSDIGGSVDYILASKGDDNAEF